MNASVYLFGEFNSGYTQYPDDYASEIFGKFHLNAKSTTQLAIHRDSNLMYYGYIRKLEQNRHIGLCVVLNALFLTRIDGLFSLFENTISGLVTKGQLIHFNEQGEIVTSVEKLYLNREEIDLITEALRAGFNRFESYMCPLPAVSYGTSKDAVKNFVVEDDLDEIIKSSYTNGYTYVYKSKGFNTAQMNSYKGVLSRITKENNKIKAENLKLKAEKAEILRQKKQFKNVILLTLVVIGCGIGLYFLYDNLNNTQGKLDEANDSIISKNMLIEQKNEKISSLHLTLADEQTKRARAESKLENFKGEIGKCIPILITSVDIGNTDYNNNIITDYGNIIYSSSTMYLSPRISYTGINSGESITLYIKLYTASGSLSASSTSPSGYTYMHTMKVGSDSGNTAYIGGWGSNTRGHWARGSYRLEIWYDSMCLKSKTFTIY